MERQPPPRLDSPYHWSIFVIMALSVSGFAAGLAAGATGVAAAMSPTATAPEVTALAAVLTALATKQDIMVQLIKLANQTAVIPS